MNNIKHIAIIMDGNRRWAKERGLSVHKGYQEGAKAVERIIKACLDFEINVLSVWAFSTENWKRPEDEINSIFSIGASFIDKHLKELSKQNIKVRLCGLRDNRVNKSLLKKMEKAENETKDNTGLILNMCFNYGGRAEILNAVREIVASGVKAEDINEQTIEQHLWTAGLPDPDLIVRTSGEQRLSGFMPWQMNYSEFYFPEFHFPDFTKDKLKECIDVYQKRNRRFGKK